LSYVPNRSGTGSQWTNTTAKTQRRHTAANHSRTAPSHWAGRFAVWFATGCSSAISVRIPRLTATRLIEPPLGHRRGDFDRLKPRPELLGRAGLRRGAT
jgi:hypothetical protein